MIQNVAGISLSERYGLLRPAIKQGGFHLKLQLIAVLALIGATAGSQAIGPLGLSSAVDALNAGDATAATAGLAFYITALWLSRATQARLTVQFGYFWRPIRKTITRASYSRILTMDGIKLHGQRSGEVIQTVSSGLSGIRTIIRSLVFGILPAIIQCIMVVSVLSYINRIDFIVIILVFLVSYGFAFHHGTYNHISTQKAAVDADANTAGLGAEIIFNQESIRLLGIHDKLLGNIKNSIENSERLWDKFNRHQFNNQLILNTLLATALATIFVFASFNAGSPEFRVGDIVLVNAFVLQLVSPIERISSSYREIVQADLYVEKLRAFLGPDLKNPDLETRVPVGKAHAPRLQMRDVTFSYRAGHNTINGVNLDVGAGHSLALVGASGSGKSTLWRLICGLYTPQRGSITIDGVAVHQINEQDLRSTISVVQQENAIYNASILENITLWDDAPRCEEIEEIISVVGLEKLLDRLPGHLETPVGERGFLISGGERQRIVLARALYRRPAFLILDEALSALDMEAELAIHKKMSEGLRPMTRIVISHRLSTAPLCDAVAVVDAGRIVESGTHGQLMANNGVYAGLWMGALDK